LIDFVRRNKPKHTAKLQWRRQEKEEEKKGTKTLHLECAYLKYVAAVGV
jgi:hypothetical protein